MSIRFPSSFGAAVTTIMSRRRCCLAAGILSSIVLFSGCAVNPPSSSSTTTLSGHKLHVTMLTNAPISNPTYHYYFLINYDQSVSGGNKNAPGPIAVLGSTELVQGSGNGFATSSTAGVNGFTDFVEYTGNTGFALYHVNGTSFVYEGQPLNPSVTSANTGTQLAFDLDLAQIVVAANGSSITTTAAVNQAIAIQWLQMNFIATDVVPIDPLTPVNKQVDSLGNTLTPQGATSFLNLNVQDAVTYDNQNNVGLATYEPEGDVNVFGTATSDVESLDLVDWSITVTNPSVTAQSLKSTKH